MSDLVHLSHSRLMMASRCGEQLRRRYIEGDRVPPGVAAVRGIGVDRSANANLESVMEGSGLLDVRECQQLARDAVHFEINAGGVFLTEDMAQEKTVEQWRDAIVDEAVELATVHCCDVAPQIQPVEVQWRWQTSIKGYPCVIHGVTDVIDEGIVSADPIEGIRSARVLRDCKTSAKKPAETAAGDSLQLTLYALADWAHNGRLPDAVALDYLLAGKGGPKYLPQVSKRTQDDFAVVLRRIEAYLQMWEAGAFVPADPDQSWWCAPKWCGYWNDCRYVHRPISVAVSS